MNDRPVTTRRLYHVHLLNEDIQKRNEDLFTASDVIISPSGVLECNRVFTDAPIKIKIFYSGQFFIAELDPQEVEEFNNPTECEHDHGEDE